MFGMGRKTTMVAAEDALRGRSTPVPVPEKHFVNGHPLAPPFPDGLASAVFGSGCFWGTEELFWQVPGVYTTAVGYAGGFTENPHYEETVTGRTGHAEVVLVVFDPAVVSYAQLLKIFWETHDPTQGMRQGNDVGTTYRSAIYTTDDAQREEAEASAKVYGDVVRAAGYGEITTEIAPLTQFYYAEDYHQQYLAKNPNGYRCHSSTGLAYPA
ncbi:peptide-methionine (S)-S-oxide reductase MsrA [Pseudonocardia ailaonensis]|uniref:Peptide methionine sulfoxide reductase MsrA n=1 Tax=Pseudonocardia ailaonensis TaxID=367279 RepID=A0ABN2NKT8_9PSEU